MAPGDNYKKLSCDEMLDNLRIALKDERISTVVLSKPEQKPAPAPRTPRTVRQPRRPQTNKTRATYNSDSDSDGEMRVVCTTDLTGEIAKQAAAGKNSYVKKFTTIAAKLDAEASKDLGLKRGDKAGENLAFVPWKFLIRYAELYVGKTNAPTVQLYFDEDTIFENHIWDFFYVYEPEDLKASPLLFVPTSQLETLLCKINEKHGFALKLPDCASIKFFYRFGCKSTPQPRYLGRTTPDATSLSCLPLPDPEDEVLYQTSATQVERDDFTNILKVIKKDWYLSKGDGKSKSKKNAFKRYDNRKAWGHATKRVQRYLGLREKTASMKLLRNFLGQGEASVPALTLDLKSPVPFDFEGDVVFICFDIETYERTPKLVTEIGYAILDTRDIRDIAPGEDGKDWFPFIQARHFRIKEYRHYKNREFVHGCPEFFQFGKSQIIGIDSVQRACMEVMAPKVPSGEYRKVVIVGHDVPQDIDLILKVDIDIYELPGLLEIIDTMRLHQHRRRFQQPQGLSGVLTDLEIPYIYLHNAGNDAVYTLQSMLTHSVRMRVNSLVKQPKPISSSSSPPKRPEYFDPLQDAGWSTSGDMTDGGDAPPQIDPLTIAKGKAPWLTKTMEE